jgi:hypothetical protein
VRVIIVRRKRIVADPTICGRVVGKQEVGNSDDCYSVTDNWRLVGAVRKVEFKLLQLD